MNHDTLRHQFVEFIPEILEEGVIYVSIQYATVSHTCCCGCGKEVVTPLSPTDWKLIFDGKTVSLEPSIGNWGFACQSHYWIKRNQVQWLWAWTKAEIEAGRCQDVVTKQTYYDMRPPQENQDHAPTLPPLTQDPVSWWGRWWRRLKGK